MPNESEAKGNSLGNTMDDRADVEVEIRRLRKKLRQIERLELCDRDINDAEALKVNFEALDDLLNVQITV